jgi:DNA-binding XRE family transcriptional regulator
MNYRKERDLTQSDLAVRFNVSGPAIFKFEKGFVTPSLQLWLKIATGMGMPEKEAVLVWVREKLPVNMRKMVDETTVLDVNGLRDTLLALPETDDVHRKVRDVLNENPDLSPVLKTFAAAPAFWDVLKPSVKEALFLVDLTQQANVSTVEQLRDAVLLGRSIQNPGE